MKKLVIVLLVLIIFINFVYAQNCTDSDGGKNYYVKGEFSGIWKGEFITGTDACLDSLGETGDDVYSSQYLGEGYCENGYLEVSKIACKYSCRDGACLGEERNIIADCTDTDGGNNIYVYGKVSLIDRGYEDRCVMVTDRQDGGYVLDKDIWYNYHDDNEDHFSECAGSNCYIAEANCDVRDDNGKPFEIRSCPQGCKDGACIRGEEPTPEPVPCGIGTCIPEEEPEEPEEIPEDEVFYTCNGCELEGKCYPMGYRKEGKYCSDNYEFVEQSEKGVCDNSFECESNICISGECIGESLIEKIIEWFKKLFGIKPETEEPGLKMCSKLLIEKDIGDYEYIETGYGHKDHQVALYSEDGEQIDIVKCCVAGYENPDGTGGAGVVCPFNNRKDVENTFYRLVNKGDIILGEYKGEEMYGGGEPELEVIVWISNSYIIANGGGRQLVEDIADAYLKKYPNDLGEIEIPEVPLEDYPMLFEGVDPIKKGTLLDSGEIEFKEIDLKTNGGYYLASMWLQIKFQTKTKNVTLDLWCENKETGYQIFSSMEDKTEHYEFSGQRAQWDNDILRGRAKISGTVGENIVFNTGRRGTKIIEANRGESAEFLIQFVFDTLESSIILECEANIVSKEPAQSIKIPLNIKYIKS